MSWEDLDAELSEEFSQLGGWERRDELQPRARPRRYQLPEYRLAQRILLWLEQNPGNQRTREVSAAVGAESRRLWEALSLLLSLNRIDRIHHGVYAAKEHHVTKQESEVKIVELRERASMCIEESEVALHDDRLDDCYRWLSDAQAHINGIRMETRLQHAREKEVVEMGLLTPATPAVPSVVPAVPTVPVVDEPTAPAAPDEVAPAVAAK